MKNIPKEPAENTANLKNERLMIDLSWIKKESMLLVVYHGRIYQFLMVIVSEDQK
jgi:hypothetical protein